MEEELDKNVGRDMTPKLMGETWVNIFDFVDLEILERN